MSKIQKHFSVYLIFFGFFCLKTYVKSAFCTLTLPLPYLTLPYIINWKITFIQFKQACDYHFKLFEVKTLVFSLCLVNNARMLFYALMRWLHLLSGRKVRVGLYIPAKFQIPNSTYLYRIDGIKLKKCQNADQGVFQQLSKLFFLGIIKKVKHT